MKPPVLLTRKLPSSVVARLEASCDVERFEGDANMPHEALVERIADKHGLISLITDSVDAGATGRGGLSISCSACSSAASNSASLDTAVSGARSPRGRLRSG